MEPASLVHAAIYASDHPREPAPHGRRAHTRTHGTVVVWSEASPDWRLMRMPFIVLTEHMHREYTLLRVGESGTTSMLESSICVECAESSFRVRDLTGTGTGAGTGDLSAVAFVRRVCAALLDVAVRPAVARLWRVEWGDCMEDWQGPDCCEFVLNLLL